MDKKEFLVSSVGYLVFGFLSIIAIIYIVKFSIEIDRENYRKQMAEYNESYKTANRGASQKSPSPSNIRYSPTSTAEHDTSFTSQHQQDYLSALNNRPLPYTINTNNPGNPNILIPPRKANIPSPNSPNSIHSNLNQYGNYMPTNNFRNSISYNNRQSRQYLLQNY